MEAVTVGDLPVLYIRQLPYRSTSNVELNPEVVYELTSHLGLQQHHGSGLTDHFAVFHIHVERMGLHHGQYLPGITLLHALHRQYITETHGEYLVQGRGHNDNSEFEYTSCTRILGSRPTPGQYWILGDNTVAPLDDTKAKQIRRFGMALRHQGVRTRKTLDGSRLPGNKGERLWMVGWHGDNDGGHGLPGGWKLISGGNIDRWYGSSPYGPNGALVALDLATRFPTPPAAPK